MSFAEAFFNELTKQAVGPVTYHVQPWLTSDGKVQHGSYLPASVLRSMKNVDLSHEPAALVARARQAGVMNLPPRTHPGYREARLHELTHYLQTKNDHRFMRDAQAAAIRVTRSGGSPTAVAAARRAQAPAEISALYHQQRPFVRGGPGILSALGRPFRAAWAGMKAVNTYGKYY